ncbi:MAG TPA: hypothetical protein VJH37_04240 [Candidatus Nanoarchaeia archaeon]|nr:hypothetical protein [Candidatus Nanoarchaeia archaeon]
MHLTLLGNFDQLYFLRVLKQIQRHIAVPRDIHLYILNDKSGYKTIVQHLPPSEKSSFKRVCTTERVSFSYHRNKQRLIVITINTSNAYLLRDRQALTGLLIHELIHLEHMRVGLYTLLQQSYKKVFSLYVQLLTNLRQKHLLPILDHIGQNALLLLKDLYTNGAVIKRGFSHELLRYYDHTFSLKKTCPRPVFYEQLRREVQKDPKVLQIVFAFEFALLSVILPFKKYKERHAKELLKHISRCYNLNMRETLRKCGPFIDYYLDHYTKPSRDFQEKYFHLIFTKIIELLT